MARDINKTKQLIQDALSAVSMLSNSHTAPSPSLAPALPQPDAPSPVASNDLSEAAFNEALNKLIAGSGHKLKVSSGKRSTAHQAELFAAAVKKYGSEQAARKWVAPPGRSNHEKGLAADLSYPDDATLRWAHENAAKYGLYFPLSNENWHIELRGTRNGK